MAARPGGSQSWWATTAESLTIVGAWSKLHHAPRRTFPVHTGAAWREAPLPLLPVQILFAIGLPMSWCANAAFDQLPV